MAKKRPSKSWLHDHIRDPYVKLAQKDGYRTRAAYKLKEIDEQDKLLRPGQIVVDLGAAPGGWSQYARRKLAICKDNAAGGIGGAIIAVDILPMEPIADVRFIQGDFLDEAVLRQLEKMLGGNKADLVISDMAPNLSGIPIADAMRIINLSEQALGFAVRHLRKDGALLLKCFQGSGYSQIVEQFKRHFKKVAARKPDASRGKSAETFILGKNLKNPQSLIR
jgi:23S rRNA (uridine2552-2'-O)-methyltransferase